MNKYTKTIATVRERERERELYFRKRYGRTAMSVQNKIILKYSININIQTN